MYLIVIGGFEVVGATGLNKIVRQGNFQSHLIFQIGFVCSFTFLGLAMRTLPAGISYAVWTGVGTIGGTLVGMLLYGESKEGKRILFLSMVLAAIVGLKLTS